MGSEVGRSKIRRFGWQGLDAAPEGGLTVPLEHRGRGGLAPSGPIPVSASGSGLDTIADAHPRSVVRFQ